MSNRPEIFINSRRSEVFHLSGYFSVRTDQNI